MAEDDVRVPLLFVKNFEATAEEERDVEELFQRHKAVFVSRDSGQEMEYLIGCVDSRRPTTEMDSFLEDRGALVEELNKCFHDPNRLKLLNSTLKEFGVKGAFDLYLAANVSAEDDVEAACERVLEKWHNDSFPYSAAFLVDHEEGLLGDASRKRKVDLHMCVSLVSGCGDLFLCRL